MTVRGSDPDYVDGQTVSCGHCGKRLTVRHHVGEVAVAVASELETTALRCTQCGFITCQTCAAGGEEWALLTCPSCHAPGGPYFFLKGTAETPHSLSRATASPDVGAGGREMRVFVSSTFRDMQAEREVLVKKVFPRIRSVCAERSVVWSEVDLRWGITDEQIVAGQLLPLCLAEIDRCRPYFIGILGDRYGYVPDRIDPEIEQQHPWLRDRTGRSLTELEMLHGVLNDPSQARHALFYFRDPQDIDSIGGTIRADVATDDADAARKLASLKQRIRDAHASGALAVAPRENYTSPEALGAMVLDDLTALVDSRFPAGHVPNSVARQRLEQQAFANSHTRALIERPACQRRLDEFAAGDGESPLVVVGDAGSGKTALLAEWSNGVRSTHPDWTVVTHFIGGTTDSANWVEMLRQIMSTLCDTLSLSRDVPFTTRTVRDEFPGWLRDAARRQRIVLVIDGLDRLVDRDGALDLAWLPKTWPAQLRLILATRPGRSLAEIDRRGWSTPDSRMTMAPFTSEERRLALDSFLALYRKSLSAPLVQAIVSAPQCANPLFLRVVLDELRQFGHHEQLAERVAGYLQATDFQALFTRVLDRWLEDFSGPHDIVRESLCLIGASRRGLAEGELLDVIETATPLPRMEWSAFMLAAENLLVNRGGRLAFASTELEAVVRARWLDRPETMTAYRRRLATFFHERAALDDRRIDELPWLLCEIEDWDRLRDVLTDIPTFLRLRRTRNRQALMHYWAALAPHGNAALAYDTALDAWERSAPRSPSNVADVLNQIGIFHDDRGDVRAAERALRRSLDILRTVPRTSALDIATREGNLAQVLWKAGDAAAAEPLMRTALRRVQNAGSSATSDIATAMNNLGRFLQERNQLEKAEPLLVDAVRLWQRANGVHDPKVAIALANLALVYSDTGRFTEAEEALTQSLAIGERAFGRDNPRLTPALNDLASVLHARRRTKDAFDTIERALAIDRAAYGASHAAVERDLSTYGTLLFDEGRLDDAEGALTEALEIAARVYGPDHAETATALDNLGALLATTDRADQGEPMIRRALEIHRRRLGEDHPLVANDLNSLATALIAAGRPADAEEPSRQHLVLLLRWSQTNRAPHPKLQTAIDNHLDTLAACGVNRADAHRKVIELADAYGIRLGQADVTPPSPAAASAGAGSTTRATSAGSADGSERMRPLQAITELVEISRSDGFRSETRDAPFDDEGRHQRARVIGLRLRARGHGVGAADLRCGVHACRCHGRR
ncbi:MAG: tetratricopeptide repeat protein [Vicinamibacterales bacterium]